MTRVIAIFLVIGWVGMVGCSTGPEPAPTPERAPSSAEEASQAEEEHSPPPQASRGSRLSMEEAEELAAQITEEDLAVFAAGVRAVAEREALLIEEGRDLETRESEARSPTEVILARQETLQEMEDALAEVGLEFETFIQMAGFVGQNPVLMERLEGHLEPEEIEAFFGG